MNKNLKQSAGFTLIEIVIFLLVAAIILPAIILPFTEGTRMLNLPTEAATMAFLAQEELERNKALDFHDIVSWSEQPLEGFSNYFSEGYYFFVDPADFVTSTEVMIWKRLEVTISHEGMADVELSTIFYVGAVDED